VPLLLSCVTTFRQRPSPPFHRRQGAALWGLTLRPMRSFTLLHGSQLSSLAATRALQPLVTLLR
jgi:hypothetical protein